MSWLFLEIMITWYQPLIEKREELKGYYIDKKIESQFYNELSQLNNFYILQIGIDVIIGAKLLMFVL